MKFYCWVSIVAASGCYQGHVKEKKLAPAAYELIRNRCGNSGDDTLTTYFLDGNCAFCVGKAAELEEEINKQPGNKVIFIAETNNENETIFNFETAKIRSCYIIDTAQFFSNYLPLNSITKLRKDGSVLSQKPH